MGLAPGVVDESAKPNASMAWLEAWVQKIVKCDQEESRTILFSFTFFFCLMSSYYILQPLRDEIALLLGKDYIPTLFRWTMLAMLITNPLMAMLMSRIPRHRLVPIIYRFFISHLLLFVVAFNAFGIGRDQTSVQGWARLLPGLFFVWVSVFNLTAISLFWSTMADRFSSSQSKKYFGFIGAGGTLGQTAGSQMAAHLVHWLGPTNLILVSVALLELSVRACPSLASSASPDSTPTQTQPEQARLKPWSGIAPVLKSGYLLGICAYLFLYAFTSSFIYFQRQELVADSIGDRAGRVKFLSDLNLYGSIATVLVQLFLTGRVIASLGLVFSLALVPGVTAVGFSLFAMQPALILLAIFEVTRKTLNFAIARPSREVLFTVVKKEDKYLAKNFIDTFVYRAGDTLASFAFEWMKVTFSLGMRGLSWAAVPCSLLWLAVAASLGVIQRKKQKELEAPPPPPAEIGPTL